MSSYDFEASVSKSRENIENISYDVISNSCHLFSMAIIII